MKSLTNRNIVMNRQILGTNDKLLVSDREAHLIELILSPET